MNTFALSLILPLIINFTAFDPPIVQSSPKHRATKLARYQLGAYLTANGTKLRVHVDKELGGQVFVQLIDLNGTLYFNRTMNQADTTARMNLDLSDLGDGDYVLKVSNGLEMETRAIKITTQPPTTVTRSIKAL
jgi:hypothetical protein